MVGRVLGFSAYERLKEVVCNRLYVEIHRHHEGRHNGAKVFKISITRVL